MVLTCISPSLSAASPRNLLNPRRLSLYHCSFASRARCAKRRSSSSSALVLRGGVDTGNALGVSTGATGGPVGLAALGSLQLLPIAAELLEVFDAVSQQQVVAPQHLRHNKGRTLRQILPTNLTLYQGYNAPVRFGACAVLPPAAASAWPSMSMGTVAARSLTTAAWA